MVGDILALHMPMFPKGNPHLLRLDIRQELTMMHPRYSLALLPLLLAMVGLKPAIPAAVAQVAASQTQLSLDSPNPPVPDFGAPEDRISGGGSRYQFIPPPPDTTGAPAGRTRGGGSRGTTCAPATTLPLTALVPSRIVTGVAPGVEGAAIDRVADQTEDTYESVLTLSSHPHPGMWVYVPFPLDGTTPVEYVLQDETDNIIHKTVLYPTLPTPGVLRVAPPDDSPQLEAGRRYQWNFVVRCANVAPLFVSGWLEGAPMAPDLVAALDTSTAVEQGAIYAQNGLWQDAVDQLGQLRLANPENATLQEYWQTLLESANLADVANAPLLDCCRQP